MKLGLFKRMHRILPVIVAAAILSSGAVALASSAQDPYISAFSKSGDPGLSITFQSEDFLSNIVGGGDLEGIVLTSLPDEGTLYCGTRELYVGEAVTTQNLDSLYYSPAEGQEAGESFSYIPIFSESNGRISTVSLTTVGNQNTAPVAENVEYETIKNIAITCKFKCSDADGDPLICKIQTAPKKGDVVVSESDPLSFVYTPYQNKTGTDSFLYVAVDASGKPSPAAKVTVKITKNAAKMTYADMTDNPSHFAAIKLAEEGILIGERMGSNYFFDPDKPVSRGEFVALALTCMGSEITTPVSKTGFADDAEIPTWVKPYVLSALKSGIVTGVSTLDGRRVFRSGNDLTRAEAAVILNKAANLTPVEKAPVFSDNESIPVWAATAAANTAARGILSVSTDGSLGVMETVTRAEAAQMLYKAMQVNEQRGDSLLGKIFG